MERYLEVNRAGMKPADIEAYKSAYPEITDMQADMMLHALGADNSKYRRNRGGKIYNAYRNYYDAGGDDVEVWNDLVMKGMADHKGHFYHVTVKGVRVLEFLTQCRIWLNYQNVADCRYAVMRYMMQADVSVGYGCWLPCTVKDMVWTLAIPEKLVRATLHKLAEEGEVRRGYYGECDSDGYPHCYHGWYLTKEARERHYDEYDRLRKEEVDRVNESLRKGCEHDA